MYVWFLLTLYAKLAETGFSQFQPVWSLNSMHSPGLKLKNVCKTCLKKQQYGSIRLQTNLPDKLCQTNDIRQRLPTLEVVVGVNGGQKTDESLPLMLAADLREGTLGERWLSRVRRFDSSRGVAGVWMTAAPLSVTPLLVETLAGTFLAAPVVS